MRLLIAEDDVALAGFLRRGLESEGYQVQTVANGQEALDAISMESPDLLILDLKLELELQAPGLDSAAVLRSLRKGEASFPVLVLTGGGDLEVRLGYLDQGADDCMFKPISLQELRARCRAILRRSMRVPLSVVQVQDLALRRMERVVERGGRQIKLTNREYALLEQLMLGRGRCVTRAMLLERVWGVQSSQTNVVDVYINYLRRKLQDSGPLPLIETVRGQGYRIGMSPQPGAQKMAGLGAAGPAPCWHVASGAEGKCARANEGADATPSTRGLRARLRLTAAGDGNGGDSDGKHRVTGTGGANEQRRLYRQ